MDQSIGNTFYNIDAQPQVATANTIQNIDYNSYQPAEQSVNTPTNYLSVILPTNNIAGIPVCKSLLPDGSFELTFGGTIPAPPKAASNRIKSDYVTRMVNAINIPDSVIVRPSGSMIKVSVTEYLTYGNLQISTQNYESFPEKINCCTIFCNPPVYVRSRLALCMLNIAFFVITPIVIMLLTFARIASIYNTYVHQVRVAAENIRRNNGMYVPDEPAALATINRLRNFASFGAAVGMADMGQMPQYQQAPQFIPPAAESLPNCPPPVDLMTDKKDEEFNNMPF